MRNDFESNYLAHHGILGMKWGKKNGPPYPLGASDHSAAEKKAGWRKSLGGGRNEDKYASKRKSAQQKRIDTAKNVKDYEKKFNAWTEAQDKNDEAWESVKEKRKAIGKTPLTRTLNAIFKADDPKVKEYAKAYDEWSDKQDILDAQWNDVKEAYSKTGKVWLSRVANNIKYGEPIIEKSSTSGNQKKDLKNLQKVIKSNYNQKEPYKVNATTKKEINNYVKTHLSSSDMNKLKELEAEYREGQNSRSVKSDQQAFVKYKQERDKIVRKIITSQNETPISLKNGSASDWNSYSEYISRNIDWNELLKK